MTYALLNREQVAERLGVSYKVAGRLIRTMTTVQIGGRVRVKEEDLAEWINAQRREPETRTILPDTKLSVVGPAYLDETGKIPTRRRA